MKRMVLYEVEFNNTYIEDDFDNDYVQEIEELKFHREKEKFYVEAA